MFANWLGYGLLLKVNVVIQMQICYGENLLATTINKYLGMGWSNDL